MAALRYVRQRKRSPRRKERDDPWPVFWRGHSLYRTTPATVKLTLLHDVPAVEIHASSVGSRAGAEATAAPSRCSVTNLHTWNAKSPVGLVLDAQVGKFEVTVVVRELRLRANVLRSSSRETPSGRSDRMRNAGIDPAQIAPRGRVREASRAGVVFLLGIQEGRYDVLRARLTLMSSIAARALVAHY
jgi:hypothetical protein